MTDGQRVAGLHARQMAVLWPVVGSLGRNTADDRCSTVAARRLA